MIAGFIALVFGFVVPAMAPIAGPGAERANRGYLGVMVRPVDDDAIQEMRSGVARLPEKEQAIAEKRAGAMKPGLRIAGLFKDGPAQAAGLKVDDILLSVNGVDAADGLLGMSKAMRAANAGEKTAVRYLRFDEAGTAKEDEATIVPITREAMSKLEPPVLRGVDRGGGRPQSANDFDGSKLNAPPEGWTSVQLGMGGPAKWLVVEEAGAPSGKNVLAVSEPGSAAGTWHLCVDDQLVFPGDCVARVRIKSDGGKLAMGGGLVIACQDPKNFYAVMLDFRTKEVVMYKVTDGKAVELRKRDKPEAARVAVAIEPGKWHLLQAERQTTRLLVRVDGQERANLDARDATFAGGKVGVLIPADAVTKFDNLTAEEPAKPSGR